VRRSQGFDGRHYKPNYLKRRVAVRMRTVGAASHRDYLKVLERDPREAEALFKRLTIHVTEFFRDPEVYRAVESKVLPVLESLSDPASDGGNLKAWCAGCSTGEEPYSLALLLSEWTASRPGWDFDILATDIDEASIQAALKGMYTEESVARLPPSRLAVGFRRSEGKVRVADPVRSRVRFQVHDLLGDWPASWGEFDLILCRNLLIYLGAAQQQVLYSRFHQVLKPRGFLVLGRTEALLGKARRLFECVDIPNRFYRSVLPAGQGTATGEGGD
jgi:chemotaxis methyl-accepting protein methylase